MTTRLSAPTQSKILSALFEQSNDAIFIIDLDWRYVTVNQRAADLFGYTRESMIGLSATHLIAPEALENSASVFERLMAFQSVPVTECVMVRSDGVRIPTDISIEMIHDDDGRPMYMQSIVRDISDRKRVEQHHLALVLEAERRRLLHEFIQAASHEFRTPLTVMNTTLYLLERTLLLDAALQRRLDTMQEQINAIDALVNRMLLLTQLERDHGHPAGPVALQLCWHAAEDALYRAMNDRAITVERQIAHDLPVLCGNAAHLTLVCRELLDNAIRASLTSGKIEVCIAGQGDVVVMTVRDYGVGIAPEDQAYIFDRFFRGDRSHHERGFGLGLSIAQLIVGQHDGAIQFESQPEQGSTFRVILPINAG
jgi:two-component system, OmpR family, sensor histidine kinase VicK